MSRFLRHSFPFLFFFFLLMVQACGSGAPSGPGPATSSPAPSKELALQCLTEGDLGCAKKNYCAIHGDKKAGLRCCLSIFLHHYFSENTQRLGEMLGYTPVPFSEVRHGKLKELLAKDGLPFGELLLLGKDQAPPLRELLKEWGMALIENQASTQEFRERLAGLGAGLEETAACLDLQIGGVQEDHLEKEVFETEDPTPVRPRDLFFLKFALGFTAYALQSATQYELGADQFPALPINDAFLQDVNGLAGEGDERFGELGEEEAKLIASKFGLLEGAFSALHAFSGLKGFPGKIDRYLNWRFSEEFQIDASAWLKAMHASISQRNWQALPDGEHQINLGSLAQADQLPDSGKIDPKIPFLVRDSEGSVQVNWDFLAQWAAPVVRELMP